MTILETQLIFQGPVFHFHDYGRKGKNQPSNLPAINLSHRSFTILSWPSMVTWRMSRKHHHWRDPPSIAISRRPSLHPPNEKKNINIHHHPPASCAKISPKPRENSNIFCESNFKASIWQWFHSCAGGIDDENLICWGNWGKQNKIGGEKNVEKYGGESRFSGIFSIEKPAFEGLNITNE